MTPRPGRVEFRFNEVVSERPQGVASLQALFLVSPRDGEPRVDWRRNRITVRPRRDWRANTVYTVTMLPGLTDLRGNARKEGATLVFATGGSIPTTRLDGMLFDWPAGRGAQRAMVQAIVRSDTTVAYVTVADSSGHFSLPHLPPANYLVRGFLDANNNRVFDSREAFDTVAVDLRDSASVELLAFVHDTIGPRIASVTIRDSLTLRVAFDKPLDPAQALDASYFRLVVLPDSAVVPIASAASARAFDESERARTQRAADSLARRDSLARADSLSRPDSLARDTARARPVPRAPGLKGPGRARGDSARGDTTRKPSRPSPETEAVIILRAPLQPATTYRLRAIEVRNLLGIARTSDRNFATPKPTPVDTTRQAPRPGTIPPPGPGTQPPPPPPPPARVPAHAEDRDSRR